VNRRDDKMAMLEIKDLEVYYGVIQAIKGILINARPMASICCSPPLKVPAS